MRIIHLSISRRGGAGIAAARSVEALRRRGLDATLWSLDGATPEDQPRSVAALRWRARLENLPLRLYGDRRLYSAWSNNHVPSRLADRLNAQRPDLVHLHWIGAGFMHLAEIGRIHAPVVWTLHDAWGFTGGCHYPGTCRRFAGACGACPQLGSSHAPDLSWFNRSAKRRAAARLAAFVSPSQWLATLALQSGIDPRRLHVIPNGLDGDVFRPGDRAQARRELGLPRDAVILVAGAHDLTEVRKGVHLLPESMAILMKDRPDKYCVLLFGADPGSDRSGQWPCETRHMGMLGEQAQVARALGAADACVLPSLQDNLPNTAIEALACGCPVIGFDSGGLVEIVEPGRTGALAAELTASSLAQTIAAWLDNAARPGASLAARESFEEKFSLVRHGLLLESLYRSLEFSPPRNLVENTGSRPS